MKRKLRPFFHLLFVSTLFFSCKEEIISSVTEEPVKDIAGTWRVVSLTRNGEELTERMDLSKFRISFKDDGTYTLQDRIAFAVSEAGSYKLNDPQYPSSLLLTQPNQATQSVNFQFPVVQGKRQLSLIFSPGCAGNTYQYNLVKEN